MNKGQHNAFKKLSPDFFSIEYSKDGIDIIYYQDYNVSEYRIVTL